MAFELTEELVWEKGETWESFRKKFARIMKAERESKIKRDKDAQERVLKMTELEKSFKELLDRHIDFYEPVTEYDIKALLEAALKPEHMKHTDEVKGLIKALKDLSTVMSYITDEANGKKECHIMACVALVDLLDSKALKPFEKEIK